MKVLTYNVSWQSMTGLDSNWEFCNNTKNKNDDRHYSHCIINVANMIDNYCPFDFIALQEASNYKILIEQSN